MSKIFVAHDGAINFFYQSSLTARRAAQGDWLGEGKLWVLYLWRENAHDPAQVIRGITKEEARKLGKAWCRVTPFKD